MLHTKTSNKIYIYIYIYIIFSRGVSSKLKCFFNSMFQMFVEIGGTGFYFCRRPLLGYVSLRLSSIIILSISFEDG